MFLLIGSNIARSTLPQNRKFDFCRERERVLSVYCPAGKVNLSMLENKLAWSGLNFHLVTIEEKGGMGIFSVDGQKRFWAPTNSVAFIIEKKITQHHAVATDALSIKDTVKNRMLVSTTNNVFNSALQRPHPEAEIS